MVACAALDLTVSVPVGTRARSRTREARPIARIAARELSSCRPGLPSRRAASTTGRYASAINSS